MRLPQESFQRLVGTKVLKEEASYCLIELCWKQCNSPDSEAPSE